MGARKRGDLRLRHGACATAVAAVLNGYADYETPVCVRLTGGDLTIEVKRDLRVFMTGTATKVYDGELDYEIKINEHFLNVKESYLFSEIGRRVR